jgi:hypothetical protein
MLSNLFNEKTTIYEKYCVYKLFYFMNSSNKHIEFIITRLMHSGLEDVITLDYKWCMYYPMTKIDCDDANYLNFLVKLTIEHHKKRDRFIINEDIESI